MRECPPNGDNRPVIRAYPRRRAAYGPQFVLDHSQPTGADRSSRTNGGNLKRAGIAGLRIYDLRRSLGSWQAKTGASLAIIGKSLGHKTASATMSYARPDQDPVRATMERATTEILKAGKLKASANVVPVKTKPTANAVRPKDRSKSNAVPLKSRK